MIPSPAFVGGLSTESIVTWLISSPMQMFSGDFLYLAVVFFVLAIVAALIGSQGVAGISMEIARILILVFVVLAIVSLLL